MVKVGDMTTFYDVKKRAKTRAKIKKISRKGGRKIAQGTSKSGTKLRKFVR